MRKYRDICKINRGAFNAGRKSYIKERYQTKELLTHITLTEFKNHYYYSDSNIQTLARKKIISMFKYKNRMFVAICPDYQSYDPMRLLELV